MLSLLRNLIPERSPLRLWYHKFSAILAAIFYGFPSERLRVIAVTGTSGKSTTVELIHSLIQGAGEKCGALSTIRFHFGARVEENSSLRTTLRPWTVQKYLRRMVREGCKYAVIEVSSHAIDQNRTWGINIDTAVLTNLFDNEHLDYHGTFAEYVRTKSKIFRDLNFSSRKAGIPKVMVLNREDNQFDFFNDFMADQKWTFSRRTNADVRSEDVKLTHKTIEFHLRVANNSLKIKVPMVGEHNLQNVLAAIAVTMSCSIPIEVTAKNLETLPGIPGRLESIDVGQPQSVIVDFSYKPSALEAVLATLRKLTKGRIVVVWGGAGGRAPENWYASAEILDRLATEIILTTDDPGATDPKKIAEAIRNHINRAEGDYFFEIEDRYEAIRYAIYTALPDDIVLIAGRGHEALQSIGNKKIHFDDREVAREILEFGMGQDLVNLKKEKK